MAQKYKFYLAGEWKNSDQIIDVINPFDKSLVGTVAAASPDDFTTAIEKADAAFQAYRSFPSYKRADALQFISSEIEKRKDEFAETITREMGKSIKDSLGEVNRAVSVFAISAEEAKRLGGELISMDWQAGSEGRWGVVRRFPMGVVAGISPFNFPLNLVAHKIGPALASGNTIVLKPASKTPIVALKLAEIIDQTDLPKGVVSILPASSRDTAPLLQDPRVKVITFTGSPLVGWMIKEKSGKKRVVLELGGNAGAIVADDADVEYAVSRMIFGGFAASGQSCISVQRVYLHESIYDRFISLFTEKVNELRVGDPLDPNVDIGPVVEEKEAVRIEEWITEAVKNGAKVVAGGRRNGGHVQPTILADVKPNMKVCAQEVFAPLVSVMKYTDFKEAVAQINDSDFGLQAGVFTNRMKDIWHAFETIDAGGVVINDVPTYRADHQPYGGMKDSGFGREGIRYSIEDYTEIKILSMNLK
ncbi:MAG: aldehyde dehydrogenase family protein [Candidatus Zixiibacteriota bacterium]